MMIASGAIASRLRAVSIRVSPLVTDEVEAEMLMESADNRLAAISNDVRVRVEDSKKKLMTVLPRRVGTFLMARVETSLKEAAVSRTVLISSTDNSLMPKRSFRVNAISEVLGAGCGVLSFAMDTLSTPHPALG